MEFSKKEYWSGKLSPSLGDLFDSGIELMSPALQAYCRHYCLSQQGSSTNGYIQVYSKIHIIAVRGKGV